MRVIFLMLIGPNAPWRPCELASQLGGVIWGAEMVVRLENELLLVHVLDGSVMAPVRLKVYLSSK
jgi:hypothetical protein